jgi:phosphate starvation-inducible PhoH-like protein
MAVTEKKINFDNYDLTSLFGANDSFIRLIESKFNSMILARGGNITIKGEENEVASIEKIFREMAFTLNTSKTLREQDVRMIIELTETGRQGKGNDDTESIVLYTRDDLIKAKTPGQANYLKSAQSNDICFAIGPAGTGKTYLAVALAVAAFKKGRIRKIILTRPAVEAGERLGFLPGDLRDKIDPYLRPLYDALEDMLPPERLKSAIDKGEIEIVPLAYMRGRTLNRAFIILDEAQNTTEIQMKMFLTRIGVESKAIVTGDVTQIDLPNKQTSGLVKAQEILQGIEGIGFAYFEKSDVVRHRLVKDIIDAYEKFYESK